MHAYLNLTAENQDEEEVAEHGGGARQEPVRLVAAGIRRREAVEGPVGFGETVHFPGGADDQAWSVGELREVLEAVGVEWEVVGDGYFRQFRFEYRGGDLRRISGGGF
ncbi:hypothetical protein FH972_017087 [Carpinus fangiana]|uniref:Uncharacterized protein n=1 Tax=Carpinus fangiana TaxID=176857 RepID=A0A5N6RIE0_9ROSI|nr:hypothetical protein FH972_017087 [Carpinus fangiana]